MIAYSLERHVHVISKNTLSGLWEFECRYCPSVIAVESHAEAIEEMTKAERNHRGLRI